MWIIVAGIQNMGVLEDNSNLRMTTKKQEVDMHVEILSTIFPGKTIDIFKLSKRHIPIITTIWNKYTVNDNMEVLPE